MELNTLELTEDQGGRVLRFAGDLNYATIDDARKGIDRASDASPEGVVLDLTKIEMFTSVALQMLLEVTSDRSERLVLLINDRIEGILDVTGVRRRFTIALDLDDALRKAGD